MVQKDPKSGNLASEIESAVDDLFSQYEAISPKLDQSAAEPVDLELESVPEPAPVIPKKAPAAQPAAPVSNLENEAPSLSMESDARPSAASASPAGDTFEAVTEALMTVDWEISQPNVDKTRKLITKLKTSHPVLATDAPSQVLAMMDKVLVTIAESPTNAPVSAPGQLQKALTALKDTVAVGTVNAQMKQTLKAVTAGLAAALPVATDDHGVLDLSDAIAEPEPEAAPAVEESQPIQFDSIDFEPLATDTIEPDLSSQPPAETIEEMSETQQFRIDADPSLFVDQAADPSQTSVPFGFTDVLHHYTEELDQAIQRIRPLENLFAKARGTEKLHAINSKIRGLIEKQLGLISDTFSSDYSQATFPAGQIRNLNDFIKSQIAVLNLCTKRLKPLEDLFGRTSGYDKLYRLNNRIRTGLERQKDALKRALHADYTPAAAPDYAAQSSASAAAYGGPLPVAMQNILKSHIHELSQCIKTVLPLEIFSGPATEIDNLQDIGRQLRERIERQKKILSRALKGDFSAAGAAAAHLGNHTCPWPTLLKATWGGQTVAFPPEQVVYEGKKTISVKTLKDLSYLPLTKLKSSPWSSLKSMVRGELAQLDKKALKDMEFPIIPIPQTFPLSMANIKKALVLILYHEGRGKVFLLDTPLETITVSEHGAWEPALESGSYSAGNLIVFGNSLPVITV